MSSTSAVIRTQRAIAALAVVLFLMKLGAWWLTHSVAVLSDALESTVNVAAGWIGLYAVRLSARPRDANHPYGHGKAEYLSAGIEGALIVGASVFIVLQAVDALRFPKLLSLNVAGVVLMALSAALNLYGGLVAIRIGHANRSTALESAGRHLLTDTWTTVAVLAGIGLVKLTGLYWLDPAVGIGMAGYITFSGFSVLRRAVAGLMDEADPKLVEEVVALLQQERKPAWVDLHNLRVAQNGPLLHLDAHLTMPWYQQVRDADIATHELESLITGHYGGSVELFVHIDGCQPYQCKLCAMPDCPVRAEPMRALLVWTVENTLDDSKHGKEGNGFYAHNQQTNHPMNTQQERNLTDEANAAGSADQNTDVTRSENRQAVADESMSPARDSDAEGDGGGEQTRNRTRGDDERGHQEAQYDKQSDEPTMNPGHVDQ